MTLAAHAADPNRSDPTVNCRRRRPSRPAWPRSRLAGQQRAVHTRKPQRSIQLPTATDPFDSDEGAHRDALRALRLLPPTNASLCWAAGHSKPADSQSCHRNMQLALRVRAHSSITATQRAHIRLARLPLCHATATDCTTFRRSRLIVDEMLWSGSPPLAWNCMAVTGALVPQSVDIAHNRSLSMRHQQRPSTPESHPQSTHIADRSAPRHSSPHSTQLSAMADLYA